MGRVGAAGAKGALDGAAPSPMTCGLGVGLGDVLGCYFAERRRFESPVTFAIHVRKSPGSTFEPWPSSQ
ncbi:hypothetical protein SAMN02787118_119167 [Streptomyces mirabilis]|uniref:Uncharacterized protein n=1 Tax=Streptomyces mirabilis TaxID=68239 RepID=A0A1I2RC43_9ACTN|nr:hypothetical protein SAMN02787118_119167 [Streptomyces mirabilis]